MRNQAIANTEKQIDLYENSVRRALDTLDKAYYLFGKSLADDMEKASYELIDLYESNPDPVEWDMERLRKTYGFDIYLINESNTIVQSSYTPDIGMDFDNCCRKLAKVIDERRADGGFFHDGIDIEQNSGQMKKYSYLSTRDKKYIVQLGYFLENSEIFQEFGFVQTIEGLVEANPSINDIHVLNIASRPLDASVENRLLEGKRKQAFDAALATGRTSEYRGTWSGQKAVYRYVRHESLYDEGATKMKVVEIIYNEKELDDVLGTNTRAFLIQLLVILVVAAGISLLIARWVARPMYLAFHDSLTGLRNRAAFEDDIQAALASGASGLGLMMIDLDNFKVVNDRLGHEAGDRLLRDVASAIRSAGCRKDSAYRLGGDEFILLMPEATVKEATSTASRVLRAVRRAIPGEVEEIGGDISVSIGIAFSPEHGIDAHTLCRNADAALYESKDGGKNTYRVFRADPSD